MDTCYVCGSTHFKETLVDEMFNINYSSRCFRLLIRALLEHRFSNRPDSQ